MQVLDAQNSRPISLSVFVPMKLVSVTGKLVSCNRLYTAPVHFQTRLHVTKTNSKTIWQSWTMVSTTLDAHEDPFSFKRGSGSFSKEKNARIINLFGVRVLCSKLGAAARCRPEPTFTARHLVGVGSTRPGTRLGIALKATPLSQPTFGLSLAKVQAILALFERHSPRFLISFRISEPYFIEYL